MTSLAKAAPWFAKTLVEKSGGALDRETVMDWLLNTPDGNQYLIAEARDHGKRKWKSFAEVEAERDEADDDAARNENFRDLADEDDGDDDDDNVVSAAVRAHGGKITAAEALTWLRSDTVGREFARAHSKGEPMNRTEKLNAFAKRAGDVVELAKSICEKGLPATLANEEDFTRLVTEYACKRFPGVKSDVAFSKLYCDSGEDGRAIRKALNIIKMPNMMSVTPMFVGGAEARDVNDPKSAMEQLDPQRCEAVSVERKMFEHSGDLLPPSPPAEKATAR
jgi:hypothetical protein